MRSSRLLLILLPLLFAACAYPDAINVSSTGESGGSTLPIGAVEPNYELMSAPAGTPPTAVTTSANLLWVSNQANAEWISPGPNGESNWSTGTYDYQTTFSLDGLDPATAVLSGLWTSDNSGCIYLNAVDTNDCVGDGDFRFLTAFSIDSGFVAGTNTIDFIVDNGGTYPNPTGLLVELTGTATAIPEPSSLSLVGTMFVAGMLTKAKLPKRAARSRN